MPDLKDEDLIGEKHVVAYDFKWSSYPQLWTEDHQMSKMGRKDSYTGKGITFLIFGQKSILSITRVKCFLFSTCMQTCSVSVRLSFVISL